MQGKAALVAEDVQSFSVGVAGGSRVVFALVEKCAGLLPLQRLVVEAHSVHGENRAGLFRSVTLNQARGSGGKLFQLADSGIDAFGDGRWFQPLPELGDNYLADRLRVHGLGEDLQGEQVVVAVHDQAREGSRLR